TPDSRPTNPPGRPDRPDNPTANRNRAPRCPTDTGTWLCPNTFAVGHNHVCQVVRPVSPAPGSHHLRVRTGFGSSSQAWLGPPGSWRGRETAESEVIRSKSAGFGVQCAMSARQAPFRGQCDCRVVRTLDRCGQPVVTTDIGRRWLGQEPGTDTSWNPRDKSRMPRPRVIESSARTRYFRQNRLDRKSVV